VERAATDQPSLLEPVRTARLRLEPWRDDRHGDALVALNRDPEVVRYLTGGETIPAEESRALSREIERHWERFGFGLWAATEQVSREVVGFVGLSHPRWFPALAPAVEVGWRLRREAWGRGLASEGARAAVERGFGPLGLEELIALIHPENGRSAAVAQRLGMTVTRTVAHPFRPHRLAVHTLRRPGAG
jgi:RimJ/RimL family protein N-acetyltransferase